MTPPPTARRVRVHALLWGDAAQTAAAAAGGRFDVPLGADVAYDGAAWPALAATAAALCRRGSVVLWAAQRRAQPAAGYHIRSSHCRTPPYLS